MNKDLLRKYLTNLIFSMILMQVAPLAFSSAEITHREITWTLHEDLSDEEFGYFLNGEPWVVGPVTITDISYATGDGRNGSMANPPINAEFHGFDSRVQHNKYSAEVDISQKLPYTVIPGVSILSSISKLTSERDFPFIKQIEILTVLEKPASKGDFRPPYIEFEKALDWNIKNVNFSKIRNYPILDSIESIPKREELTKLFLYPWIELKTNWGGRYFHAEKNFPEGAYGRDLAKAVGEALLWVHLDQPLEVKRDVLIGLMQAGIDIYGGAAAGGIWEADGGHNPGRKMLLLFAGILFNDKRMLDLADASKHLIFQEDQQSFYVSRADVARSQEMTVELEGALKYFEPYEIADIGMAEWGIRHSSRPESDNKHWYARYRQVAGSAIFSHVVAAKLMESEELWNWPATFDYYDRYFTNEWPEGKGIGTGKNGISEFAASLYLNMKNNKIEFYNPDGADSKSKKPHAPRSITIDQIAN